MKKKEWGSDKERETSRTERGIERETERQSKKERGKKRQTERDTHTARER